MFNCCAEGVQFAATAPFSLQRRNCSFGAAEVFSLGRHIHQFGADAVITEPRKLHDEQKEWFSKAALTYEQ